LIILGRVFYGEEGKKFEEGTV
jgi:hypothetical protein